MPRAIRGLAPEVQARRRLGRQGHGRLLLQRGPEHALPWRPAFVADGGYGGAWLLAGASRYLSRNIWMGGFVHYRNLSGASFADSPLVETPHAFIAGFVVAYLFARSNGD